MEKHKIFYVDVIMEFEFNFAGVCQKYGLKKGPETFELYLGLATILDFELFRLPTSTYRPFNAVDVARLAALEPYQSLKLDNAEITDKQLREIIKYWACDMLYRHRGWLYSMLGIAFPKSASAVEQIAKEATELQAPYNAEDLAAILSFEKAMAGNAAKLEAGRLAKQDGQRQQHLPLLGRYAKTILNKLNCFENLNITTRRNIVYDLLSILGLVGKYAVSDYDYTSKDDFQLNDAYTRDEKATRIRDWISSYNRTKEKFERPELDSYGWMQADKNVECNRFSSVPKEEMKEFFEGLDF